MNRVDFTINIVGVLHEMILLGEHPIIDYVLRSAEEQNRLYRIGRGDKGPELEKIITNRDGYKIPSAHQSGKAMDIYFIEDGQMVDPKKGWTYWHSEWEKMGGKPMINWDKGHFEG
jgi:hypothetical protein